jgi:hypothetical protein
MFTLSLNFYLAFGEAFPLREAYFHKIRETLSRSHFDLNTTDYNEEQTESFSAPTELHNVCMGI